jgi:hypothetical protein
MSNDFKKIIFLLLATVNLIISLLFITVIAIGILYPNKLPIEMSKISSVVQHSIITVTSILSTFLFMKVHCIKELESTNGYWIDRIRRNSPFSSEELFPNSAGYKAGYK